MDTSYPPELQDKFVRPASIAIRFSDEQQFRQAIGFYAAALGYPQPSTHAISPSIKYCSFPVGYRKSLRGKDIELRLEWRKNDPAVLRNRTIIYWEIASRDIAEVRTALKKLGYEQRESDKSRADLPEDDRFVVENDKGYLLGGHPNPTFPPGTLSFVGNGRASTASSPALKLLASLVVGPLLLGAIQFFRSPLR